MKNVSRMQLAGMCGTLKPTFANVRRNSGDLIKIHKCYVLALSMVVSKYTNPMDGIKPKFPVIQLNPLLGVRHDLSHDPEGGVFAGSLHPAVGIVEDGEGMLAMADLKLVLLLHHLNERGVPWGRRGEVRVGQEGRKEIKVKGEEIRDIGG